MKRFTYYAASYWYRDCEASSVAVVLARNTSSHAVKSKEKQTLLKTVEAAMEEERKSCLLANCDCGCEGEETCSECESDLCWSGIVPVKASALFTAKELLEHRRELLAGEVVWLDKGML